VALDKQTLLDEHYWRERFQVTKDDIDFLYGLIGQENSPRNTDNLIYHLVLRRCGLSPRDDPLLSLMAELPIEVDIYQPLNDYRLGQEIFFANLNCEKTFGPNLECAWWKEGEPHCRRIGTVIGRLPKSPVSFKGHRSFLQGAVQVRFAQCAREKAFTCDLDPRDPYARSIQITPKLTSIQGLGVAIVHDFGRLIKDKLVPTLERDLRFTRFGDEWFLAQLKSQEVEQLVEEASEQLVRTPVPVEAADVLDTVLDQMPKTSTTVFEVNQAIEQTGKYRKVGKRDKARWVPDTAIWPPPPGKPKQMRIPPVRSEIQIGTRQIPRDLQQVLDTIEDELQEPVEPYRRVSQVEFAITASHRFHGTLPLTKRTRGIFPPGDTDAPVTFIDARSDEHIPGGFAPQDRYAWGLAEWYDNYGIPSGGKIRLERTEVEGEIKIDYVPNREGKTYWIRVVSYDQRTGKLTAKTRKYTPLCEVDPDLLMHGIIFEDRKAMKKEASMSIFDVMCQVFPVLAKQGESVHYKQLFNCVNCVRRCSPYTVFAELSSRPCFRRNPNQPGYWFFDEQVADKISPAVKIIGRLDERLVPLHQKVDTLQARAEEQARRLEFLKL
jgi:hypothetical protein